MIRIVKLQLFKKNRYVLKTQEGNENTPIDISDRQKHFEKTIHFIQNISNYWLSGVVKMVVCNNVICNGGIVG
jgi:hypothetical protein